jgi:hypothetical protein
MRRAVLTIVGLGLLGAPVARAAEPSLFETFKAVCFDTRADTQKALAAAGPAWTDVPVFPGVVRKTRQVGDERWNLVLMEQVSAKGEHGGAPFPIRMRVCKLSANVASGGVNASVRALMGADPTIVGKAGPVWNYFDEPDGRRFLSGAEQTAGVKNLVAKEPVDMVMSSEGTTSAEVDFVEVSRVEP